MKEIKDYLHLYLGCECIHREETGIIEAISKRMNVYDGFISFGDFGSWYPMVDIKPILRPLSDMTENECLTVAMLKMGERDWNFVDSKIHGKFCVFYDYGLPYIVKCGLALSFETTHEIVLLLISKHFDLFGLIESGLAIKAEDISVSSPKVGSEGGEKIA